MSHHRKEVALPTDFLQPGPARHTQYMQFTRCMTGRYHIGVTSRIVVAVAVVVAAVTFEKERAETTR